MDKEGGTENRKILHIELLSAMICNEDTSGEGKKWLINVVMHFDTS